VWKSFERNKTVPYICEEYKWLVWFSF
jgi:hypothetical protein